MTEKIKLESGDIDYSEQVKTFSEYFSNGQIEEIEIDEVPENIMKHFEGKSKSFILPDEYQPGNFEKFFVIKHENGNKTFVAQQTKNYSDNGTTEKLTYIVDVDKNGAYIGHGAINISTPDEYFKNKPFVDYTKTLKEHRKKGLGTRRLYLMNAVSQMLYGRPLHSALTRGPKAESLWQKLAANGEAKKIKQGDRDRYVFVVKTKSQK
ncbi:hypothetical protein MYX06_02620 [Patescibacteria group bacterium AH-259-L05]|nr:hypothetical protein [Patescibacteria group bacterium AH-259-L05]